MFAARLSVSVVIAAGFSLWLGWEKPVWAMFAVIYCALGDEGESLHKGTLRILATFMGGGMSLLITALFNDHRWAFGGAVLVWIMFCSYMMQNNRRYYMWLVAAMLTVLMPIYSAEQPARAFDAGPVERVGAILNISPALTREDVLKGLDEADASRVIAAWLRSGLLLEEEYRHPTQRKLRMGVRVDDARRPTVAGAAHAEQGTDNEQ